MTVKTIFMFAVTMAGCAAAAYAIGRHARQRERRELKQDLHTWEDEGGNLAPPAARSAERTAAPG